MWPRAHRHPSVRQGKIFVGGSLSHARLVVVGIETAVNAVLPTSKSKVPRGAFV